MIDLPVFISYRQDDGTELASWLYESLQGLRLMVPNGSILLPATLSVYFDRAAPAVSDWQHLLDRELERARALLVVCTPAAAHEFESNDWFYQELHWWLENRNSFAPILVVPTNISSRWVPKIIDIRWPKAQLVKVDPPGRSALSFPGQNASNVASIRSILGGIAVSVQDDHIGLVDETQGDTNMLNIPGLYTWEKDRHFRYIRCNDNYARAAGYDSPKAMLGKTDDEMSWHSLADFFRSGDHQIISGKGPPRINVQEVEIMVDRVAEILVTENQLLDGRGECVGVTGFFIDITGQLLVQKPTSLTEGERGLRLGKEFGDEYLTEVEVEVLKSMLKTHSAEKIAGILNLKRSTVESHIQSIKQKLQCVTDGDVVAATIRSGLPLTLFGTGNART